MTLHEGVCSACLEYIIMYLRGTKIHNDARVKNLTVRRTIGAIDSQNSIYFLNQKKKMCVEKFDARWSPPRNVREGFKVLFWQVWGWRWWVHCCWRHDGPIKEHRIFVKVSTQEHTTERNRDFVSNRTGSWDIVSPNARACGWTNSMRTTSQWRTSCRERWLLMNIYGMSDRLGTYFHFHGNYKADLQ